MATRLSLGDERLGRDDLGRPHEHHRRHLTVDHGPPHRPAQSQSQSQSQSKQRPYRLALIVADAYRRSQSRSDFDNHSLRSPLTLSLNPSAHRHHGRAGCGWLPWPPSPSTSLYYIQVPEVGLGKVPTPNPAIRQPRPAFAIDLDDAPTEKMLHSGRTRFQTASTPPREETRVGEICGQAGPSPCGARGGSASLDRGSHSHSGPGQRRPSGRRRTAASEARWLPISPLHARTDCLALLHSTSSPTAPTVRCRLLPRAIPTARYLLGWPARPFSFQEPRNLRRDRGS
ncbi:hypothetical protein JHW43_008236 [Diplocarpon mali]|nr:hypothetical protein JHW43_008236 [Diplocarpon mali]